MPLPPPPLPLPPLPLPLPCLAEFNKLKEKTDENKSKAEGDGQEASSGQKEVLEEGNIKTAAASALAAAAVKTQVCRGRVKGGGGLGGEQWRSVEVVGVR